ncbi:MAG: ankyrin repeat domain-containing protein [Alphaproteobacteria bacterium]
MSTAKEPPALPRTYAWFSALMSGDTDTMTELLARGLPVDVRHPLRHTTALMEATRLGRILLVQFLLGQDAAPAFLCGTPKGTPIHCALFYKQWEIAELLIDAANSITITDELGRTPLHVLAMEPLEDSDMPFAQAIAGQLIGKRCPLDALDTEGITVLHYCVINDHGRLAALLLRSGAAPDILTPDTRVSPLAIAALERNLALAALLMEFGANPNLPMKGGATPLSIMPQLARLDGSVPLRPRARKQPAASILPLRRPSAG